MKVFLSWSGDMSRELAEALRDWLPGVLQSVKPFFTPNDIEKGARWNKDISKELESSAVGIFCLTKENLTKPWIMFEAGALSKSVDSSRVCPVLFGADNADLEGPLVQFQASPFSELEIRKLIKTINNSLGDQKLEDGVLASVFDMWWPRLNEKVTKILDKYASQSTTAASTRSDRDLLEEVLQLVRISTSTSAKYRNINRASLSAGALRQALGHLQALTELAVNVKTSDQGAILFEISEIFVLLRHLAEKTAGSAGEEADINEAIASIEFFLSNFAPAKEPS